MTTDNERSEPAYKVKLEQLANGPRGVLGVTVSMTIAMLEDKTDLTGLTSREVADMLSAEAVIQFRGLQAELGGPGGEQ